MKTSLALLFAALAQRSVSTRSPLLQWDPDTVKDCIDWYNNGEGKTCEYVRELYGITPVEFNEWNPSVGLDCKGWYWQSYCVITQRKLDSIKPTTTSFKVTTTSTSKVPSLAPSPTAWNALGCYTQNSARPILEQSMNANGDASLTIPKCKNSCYRRAFNFAGVQEGNQCWCGSYVGGEWTKNQTDCHAPCTGNKAEMCGGKGVVNVFEALQNAAPVVTVTKSASVNAAAASNGASKNRALFGMDF
ncbi:WSC domain-containing protein [Boeremia exigua]|uniref:WSC domain-containing protein n=1 Tax=Boeremia exigua TaxID=749465 RepID=UPI001E8EEF09|nr:WSC domain-containing protein [Boeremia exigua]KAH6625096.1 WSC domain-containing protein [Boeremia exigua]